MRKKAMRGLLCIVVLLICFPFTNPVIAASPEDEVLQVAINSVKAANTKDFDLLSSLYWHSPKTSLFDVDEDNPKLIQGWEKISEGMGKLMSRPDGAVSILLQEPEVTMLGDDSAVITGYHQIHVNPPLVEKQITMRIRETLVLRKIDGKWLIVHQHGSYFK